MKQTIAVSRLTLATLPQRGWMSLAAIGSVALAVGVLMAFLALAAGFAKTAEAGGREDVAMVLRSGSGAELNSTVTRDQVRLLEEGPGVARDSNGNPLVSAELYVIADGIKRSSQTDANLTLRGVGLEAATVRQGIVMREGRMFTPGTNELVVGAGIQREFDGFELGSTPRLGQSQWTVVGVFESGGSVFESEIWGDARVLQNLFNRGTNFQSVRVALTSPEALEAFDAYVQTDPRLQLDVRSEKSYLSSQASNLGVLVTIGSFLGAMMAIGAFAGAWNTMYASVDSRAREIATLRAIGFSGGAAFIAALLESIVLALIGGLVGALGVAALFDGRSASTLGNSFTQIVFRLELSPEAIMQGMILALIIGFLGGVFPAFKAARTPLLRVHDA